MATGISADPVAPPSAPPVAAPHPQPDSGWHFAEWACEFVGTLLLILGGLSAVVLDFETHSPVASVLGSHSARLALTGLLFASCGGLVAISPLGRRSGAHLNPSVTLAFWCDRHLKIGDVFGYIVSQCLGAIAGTVLLRALWGKHAASVHFAATSPGHGIGPWGAIGIEALMTASLVLVIFSFLSSTRTAHWTPVAVCLLVSLLVCLGAPYTGTSLNTARSLGPALISGRWSDFWVYVIGPPAGALVAAALWVLVPRSTLTGKLFHDSRYRSFFRSTLPARSEHEGTQ